MAETRTGAVLHLLRATFPMMALRGAVALAGGCLATCALLTGARGAETISVWPWIGALVALIAVAVIVWAAWPVWGAQIALSHSVAMALILLGATIPHGRAQIRWTRSVLERSAERWSQLARARRLAVQAHREALSLVQGLAARLPVPMRHGSLLGRTGVAALAGPLGLSAVAQSLADDLHAPQGSRQRTAAVGVAVSAEHAHALVAALARPALAAVLVAVGVWGVAVLAAAPLAGIPWVSVLAVPTIWTVALWFALGAPVLAALTLVHRAELVSGHEAGEPWHIRLSTSSPAYRALAAWPGSPDQNV